MNQLSSTMAKLSGIKKAVVSVLSENISEPHRQHRTVN